MCQLFFIKCNHISILIPFNLRDISHVSLAYRFELSIFDRMGGDRYTIHRAATPIRRDIGHTSANDCKYSWDTQPFHHATLTKVL